MRSDLVNASSNRIDSYRQRCLYDPVMIQIFKMSFLVFLLIFNLLPAQFIAAESDWWDSAKESAFDGWELTKQKAPGYWETAKKESEKAWEVTKEKAPEYWDKATEVTSKAWEASKENAPIVWDTFKETSVNAWAASKETVEKAPEYYSAAKQKTSDSWKVTKEKSSQYWDATTEFTTDNAEVIAVGGAVVACTALYFMSGGEVEVPDYSDLEWSGNAAPGKDFSVTQKAKILSENMNRNNGTLRSDLSGVKLVMPQKYTQGYSPSNFEAQVDHIFPRSKGGANSFDNAQVLSRSENLLKSDKIE